MKALNKVFETLGAILALIVTSPIYIMMFLMYVPLRLLTFLSELIGKSEKHKRGRSIDEYKNKHHIPDEKGDWNRYEGYLNSDVWKSKRSAVLERADGECEMDGCKKEAKEVHHKSYPKNLGYEELGDLKAVCKECHSKLHPEKPDRYTG